MSVVSQMPTQEGAVTIADRVFEDVKEAIVLGRIAQGSKISEPELARTYGISRGPLREAIGRLEACGLVDRRPNVGARVVTLSAEQLVEIYLVREALEGMAARLAAEAMTDSEITDLRSVLVRHAKGIEEDSEHAYFQQEGDLDFHFKVVLGSHNSRLVELLCDDLYQLVRLYRYQSGMRSQRGPRALQEHVHILDAIEHREPEMAEQLMRAHIRASRLNIEKLIRSVE
ncbi:MAG: GntR family transcriptional regulator [Gammaproteobacteria bacterium]